MLFRLSSYFLLMLVASLMILAIAAVQLLLGPPSVFFPLPLPLVIPALLGMNVATALLPPAIFFLWSHQLLSGTIAIPMRTHIVFGILSIFNFAYIAFSWSHGTQYQGLNHTVTVLWMNIVAVFAVGAFGAFGVFCKKYWISFGYHAAIFTWLTWISFPYFGELP